MTIKYECYNSWNAFNSFILRLYKAMYVVFVSRLGKYSKRSICVVQPMTKFIYNSMQFRLHVESFKLDMINLACGVIQISIKCSCLEIFDQRIIQARHDRFCLWSDSNLKQYSCLEIFDQQGNLNLIPLIVDSLSYHTT